MRTFSSRGAHGSSTATRMTTPNARASTRTLPPSRGGWSARCRRCSSRRATSTTTRRFGSGSVLEGQRVRNCQTRRPAKPYACDASPTSSCRTGARAAATRRCGSGRASESTLTAARRSTCHHHPVGTARRAIASTSAMHGALAGAVAMLAPAWLRRGSCCERPGWPGLRREFLFFLLFCVRSASFRRCGARHTILYVS